MKSLNSQKYMSFVSNIWNNQGYLLEIVGNIKVNGREFSGTVYMHYSVFKLWSYVFLKNNKKETYIRCMLFPKVHGDYGK